MEDALRKLADSELTVVVHRDDTTERETATESTVLEGVGQDRPGIIRQISHALAEFGVNVEELESDCASAAMSGEAIFKARFQVSIPASCQLEELRRRIEQIGADLIVDVTFAASR